MRYIIKLNGEEPITAIEEILDRELGRDCVCEYADYDGEYLDEIAENASYSVELEEHCKEYCYELGFKDGYRKAKGE